MWLHSFFVLTFGTLLHDETFMDSSEYTTPKRRKKLNSIYRKCDCEEIFIHFGRNHGLIIEVRT